MELVKLTCPPFKNPSHSQQFEIVSLVDAEYMDKYFTTWTNISIHEQLLLLEKKPKALFLQGSWEERNINTFSVRVLLLLTGINSEGSEHLKLWHGNHSDYVQYGMFVDYLLEKLF